MPRVSKTEASSQTEDLQQEANDNLREKLNAAEKERSMAVLKYDTFKKRLARLLSQAHPSEKIEHKNGSKLFTALERDLLGTIKLCD